jgi:hypothetical protein
MILASKDAKDGEQEEIGKPANRVGFHDEPERAPAGFALTGLAWLLSSDAQLRLLSACPVQFLLPSPIWVISWKIFVTDSKAPTEPPDSRERRNLKASSSLAVPQTFAIMQSGITRR